MSEEGANRHDESLDMLSARLASGTLHEALPAPEHEVESDPALREESSADDAPREADAPRARTTFEPFVHESVLQGYVAGTRDVPLLTHDEEKALGKAMSESRAKLTLALGRVPLASKLLLEATREARAGDRRLSDVFQFPYRTDPVGQADTGPGPAGGSERRACYLQTDLVEAALASVTAHDDPTRPDTPSLGGLRAHLAATFARLQPSYPMLRRGLERCVALDREARALEAQSGANRGDLLAERARRSRRDARRGGPIGVSSDRAGGPARALARLEALRREAGVGFDVVREVCAAGVEAEREFREARRRMVESNIRLAYFMARKLMGQGVAPEDLVQEAVLGLMRAAEKYDYRLGWRFSTYACEWIWQGITRSIAESSRTVRVPAHMHDVIVRLRKERAVLSQRLGRDPTVEELARAAGMPEERVERALRASTRPVSLSTPLFDDEGTTLELCLHDPDQADPSDDAGDSGLARHLAEMLDELGHREATVLRLRHGLGGIEPRTLDEIGRTLGISRERTRQIESRAIARLRERADPSLIDALAG